MKRSKFNLAWILLLAIFAFSACDKDDPDPILVEDGAYIIGTSTTSSNLELKGMMESGIVEGEGYAATPREGMYEKFVYLTKTGEGFQFVVKAGAEEKTYGLKTGTKGTLTLAGENDQITAVVDTAGVILDGGMITVAADGLYHVVLDTKTESYYVIPINNWSMKLSEDVELAEKSLTQDNGTWEKTDVELRKGNFKYRYEKGWKIITHSFTIFTNFGGTTDELALGAGDIPITLDMEGIYTVTLNWDLKDGFTTNLVKTDDVIAVDPSTFVWSFIGNAFNNADGVPAGWDYDVNFTYQSKEGNVYTYKIDNITLLAGGEFKVRRDADWAVNFGFEGTIFAGDKANFTDQGGNIKVTETKTYSVTFDLNWETDARTLTFTEITK